jgi:hypothetical protein
MPNRQTDGQIHLPSLIPSNRVRECVVAVLLGASWPHVKRILCLCFAFQYN